MSIKGKSQELFVGKSGINIITFMGNRISIKYTEMKRIDYCYANAIRSGYMNFVLKSDKIQNFAFTISANEPIGRTVFFIKEHAPTLIFKENCFKKTKYELKAQISPNELDPKFKEAGEFIIVRGKASIGMVQRAFKINFNCAAKIIDQLTSCGVIEGQNGIKPRKILVSLQEFQYFVSDYENIYYAINSEISHKAQLYNNQYDCMEGHDFECFCANLLRKNGYKNVEVTPKSGDQGIDVIAYKEKVKYGIQCKCYSSDIGNKAVQEAFSGARFYDCHVPVVLTNQHFTKSAIELASKNNVILWDREHLNNLINSIK
ncbi:restriction endonuclease [Enterocloster sp. HCN-30185]|uniref:restriction endonuclease n=1 Tax=Enterocloster sp. HCN-30185 TaxID=3134663 RepID=UPI0030C4FBA0